MRRTNVTTETAAAALAILKAAQRPMTAIEIAVRLDLSGKRETKRRKVRAIVKDLRDSGARIVASLEGGYWLTEDPQIWQQWNDGRQIEAKQILAETHRRKRQLLADKSGQRFLFAPAAAR